MAFSSHFQGPSGLGVSFATLKLQPQGAIRLIVSLRDSIPLHLHSRASETNFMLLGQLKVGFGNITNSFYSGLLSRKDIFVFPESVEHYYANLSSSTAVQAVATFGSSEPDCTRLLANLVGFAI
ncbi:protein MpCupin81 [Marchantia polymorpha subsp. ruderalis]|uniref:Germin-like protein n=2 Tax=Marchantia polymorpha TaxID=3197 RepID=A0AAF6BE95_MARPO|nr:hypothetical protein MARPO_0124s0055 [Marchantia polymorpha]BBN10329.1 hypothetical protein Mp_5g02680 [Marchantia polymorpha subsp. ruderalis]|eukprot:PTQ30489.1 hypothetical protein MARPO_0124s0055 [Marchantia polymorpha]